MYRLLFQNGEHKGRRVAIRQGPVMFGRHPDCTIRLPDQGVALQHAILEDQPDGAVRLRRMATEVVLRVNQQDVTEAELHPGDVIEIGPQRFEFQRGSSVRNTGPVKQRLGLLQRLTLLAVGMLVVGQMAFLLVISVWRHGQPPPTTPAAPLANALSTTISVATNIPRLATIPATPPVVLIKTQLPPQVVYSSNAVPAAPTESAALSNEIQQMQNEIGQLHRDVAALPVPVPVVALPAIAMTNLTNSAEETDDLVLVQAQRMFKKTMGHAAQLDPETLDAELETLENMAPDFLPPYVERAHVLERRGLQKEALAQWQRVQKLAKNGDLKSRADAEIVRLGSHPGTAHVQETVMPPAASPSRAAATHPVACLAQIEQQKLMANENFDELRTLRITIAPVAGVPLFNPSGVEVVVTFFDRSEKANRIAPSHAIVPGAALRAAATALVGAPLELTATYQVPRGFRQQEIRQSGAAWHYYGYRVELLYHGQFQDQREHPTGLPPAD